MKAIKYLVAGLLVMGLAAPAMAQDVYKRQVMMRILKKIRRTKLRLLKL